MKDYSELTDDRQFCVYKTTYSGDLLPPFYIGSSSIQKIKNGYRGTVLSKKYKDVWNKELKTNPKLFNVEILSTWPTRQEALTEELHLHNEFNVVKSSEFINMAKANIHGFLGMDVSGANNPRYGCIMSEETKTKIGNKNKNRKVSEETRKKLSISRKGKLFSESHKQNMKKPKPEYFRLNMIGKKQSLETQIKKSETRSILPKEIKNEVVKRRNSGEKFVDIHKWVLSLNYEIGVKAISAMYNKIIKRGF